MRASLTRLVRRALPWQHAASCPALQSRALATDGPSPAQDADSVGNDRVRSLADSIMQLTVLEASWLSEILRKKLNLERPAMGAMPMMMAGMPAAAPAAPAGGAAAADAAPAEAKKEQTEFNVKLEAFPAEAKIKVIKEIRAITNLGLKEAKELVEKAPVVVKAAVSKADAEALQKQLEAVGGKVALE